MPTNMLKGLKENKIEFLTQTNKLVFFNFLVKHTFFLLFDVLRGEPTNFLGQGKKKAAAAETEFGKNDLSGKNKRIPN